MRSISHYLLASAAVLSIGLAACSDSSSPDDDDDEENPSTMTATVNGAAFVPAVVLGSRNSSSVSFFGRDAQNNEIIVDVSGMTPASYGVGSGQSASVRYQSGGNAWTGHLTGGSGAVIITAIDATYMTGTFNVTLVPQTSGASGTRIISGTFTIYFGQT